MKQVLLSCDQVNFFRNDVSILENVNFSLYTGHFHLLLGENGAGKTSIVNLLSGIYASNSYSGTIVYQDVPLHLHTPQDAIKKGIITIHQDICLYENMSIAENLYANLPDYSKKKGLNTLAKKIKAANSFFIDHGITLDTSRMVYQCSTATKRTVELMKLYLQDPKLLILDEPFAAIGGANQACFLELLNYFKEKHTTILFITHDYKAILPYVDYFLVFQDKQLTHTMKPDTFYSSNVETLLWGDFSQKRYPKINIEKGAEVLCAEHIANDTSLNDISFSLYKGEILGIFGCAGSGRNALAKALFGLEDIKYGSLYIDRLKAKILSPNDAINLGLAYITDERSDNGLFHNLDSLENVYSIKGNNDNHFWRRTKYEYNIYEKYANHLNISTSPSANTKWLSGGEQQKIILMRWLMSSARIFLFNEPTQSLDIPSKIDIYNLFNDLVIKGASIIVFSSNLEELMSV